MEKYPIGGIANISGGGLPENVPRSLAEGCEAVIKKGSWPVLPVFEFLQREGNIDEEEMYNTFNMGIAMVLVVRRTCGCGAAGVDRHGRTGYVIGEVVAGERKVTFTK